MPERGSFDIDQIQPDSKGALIATRSVSGVDHSGVNLVIVWLRVGADGEVLTADSTVPEGFKWAPSGSTTGVGGTHSEILTDGLGNPILANGDFIYVLGVAD